MIPYFHWIREYPLLNIYSEVYHYLIIVGFVLLVGKCLLAQGYPKHKIRMFVLLAIGVFLSAGYLGSRVTTIFYQSFEQRNLVFFFVGLLFSEKHIFQISPMLPLLICTIVFRLTRLKYLEALDAASV